MARSVIQSSTKIIHWVGESQMNAFDLCQKHVVTVRRHEELSTAARMMRERSVGCLVVVEPGGAIGGERAIGMLTDRDLVTRVIVENVDPRDKRVEDVMTRHPLTVHTYTTIDEPLSRMRRGAVRRVPVIDDRGRLAGILALDDIFEHFGAHPHPPVTPTRREPFRRA